MPFIWTRNERNDWAAVPLSNRPLDVQSIVPSIIVAEKNGFAKVLPTSVGLSRHYILVWGSGGAVRINGLPLPTGIHYLVDRDEIRIGGHGPLYFSKETFAVIEPFEGSRVGASKGSHVEALKTNPRPTECGSCGQPIEVGASVVHCPNCFVAYHQGANSENETDLNCWTNAPACRFCGYPTALDAGFRWTPDDAWA